MKTKKHKFESMIQRIIWLEIKEKIVLCSIFLMVVIVGIWKYEIYTTSILAASKWLILSIGSGFCLGSSISYYLSFFAAEWLLQRKKNRIHQQTQNSWMKMKALQKRVEEDPHDKKAKIRLEKVEYRLEQLGVISQLLTNPYKKNLGKKLQKKVSSDISGSIGF